MFKYIENVQSYYRIHIISYDYFEHNHQMQPHSNNGGIVFKIA